MTRNLKEAKYTPTIGGAQRTFDARVGERISLKDFGAVGNGIADDTAAVQSAVDTKRAIYVPAGEYKLTSPIQYSSIRMFGEGSKSATGLPKSYFIGDTGEAPLFHKSGGYFGASNTYVGSVSSATGTSVVVRDIAFRALDTAGCCFQTFNNVAPVMFQNCLFNTAFRGLFLNQTFDALVMNCEFGGGSTGTLDGDLEAVALYAASHTTVIECTWNNCGCAIASHGTANNFLGGRIELCSNVARLGGFSWNNDLPSDSVFRNGTFTGFSLEGNNRGVLLADVKYSHIGNMRGLGYGSSEWMIEVQKVDPYTNFGSMNSYGSWSYAVIVNNGTRQIPGDFTNSASGRPVHSNRSTTLSIVDNWYDGHGLGGQNLPHPARYVQETTLHDRRLVTYFANLTVRGLRGLSASTAVQPNNLGRIEAITTSATSHAVVFQPNVLNAGLVNMTAAAAAADAGSTLPAGTYYYCNTHVSVKDGSETSNPVSALSTNYFTATPTAGQRVNLTFGTRTWPDWNRRVYRGTSTSFWQGYWDMPVSQGSFADDGAQAFTGAGSPNKGSGAILNPISCVEADADYAILATPSWSTTCYVTAKTTTGFTLNFTTAPASATVQWLLFRP